MHVIFWGVRGGDGELGVREDGAASAGITIPDGVPDPQTSAIYSGLAIEMRLAQSTANGTYAAVGFT